MPGAGLVLIVGEVFVSAIASAAEREQERVKGQYLLLVIFTISHRRPLTLWWQPAIVRCLRMGLLPKGLSDACEFALSCLAPAVLFAFR